MRSRRFFPSRERSSILLLAITINSQPQKNRAEKTRQRFHENVQRFAKAARYWGTGRRIPFCSSPWGTFVTWSVLIFAQKQKLKIDFNFQFSIFDFDFLFLDSSKTEKLRRVTDCNIVGKTKLPLTFIFLFIVDKIKVKI